MIALNRERLPVLLDRLLAFPFAGQNNAEIVMRFSGVVAIGGNRFPEVFRRLIDPALALQYGAPLPARTAVRSPLFAARCSLPAVRCPLFAARCSLLFAARCSRPA